MEGKPHCISSADDQLLSRCPVLPTSTGRLSGPLRSCLLDSVCQILAVVRKLTSRTDALPVLYVFPRQKLDVKEAGQALLAASSELAEGSHKGIMVVWDVSYDWLSGTSNVAHVDSRQLLILES